MIFLITTRGHGYTWRSLLEGEGSFGCPVPQVKIAAYDWFFEGRQLEVPVATYIFSDLDRLAPWELRLAARLYRAMTEAGLRCLNDPAHAMSRVELLAALHTSGINPFSVTRLDSDPRPPDFPVFLRSEGDHLRSFTELYHDQAELDHALSDLRGRGVPLRGLIAVGHAAEPYNDKLWAKWGTWRIGEKMIVEHLMLEDNWLVKRGHYLNLDDAAVQEEHDAVANNRFAADMRKVFEIGRIEFGRADHATFDGRQIVYEINTNPFLSRLELDPRPLRAETQLIGRRRLAAALAAIDTPENGMVVIEGTNAPGRP